jgi:hypothetical protein
VSQLLRPWRKNGYGEPITRLHTRVSTSSILASCVPKMTDQNKVREQTLKFLNTLQPGQRMAIFALGSQLRFIQGFTDDPAALAAAISRKIQAHIYRAPRCWIQIPTAANQQTAVAMRAASDARAFYILTFPPAQADRADEYHYRSWSINQA